MAKKVIIVTGPIGSGKSTAIEHISNKGYSTLDLDKISNEIINSKESIKFLDINFPGVIKNKKLDKASLADIVFSDNEKLKTLEDIGNKQLSSSSDLAQDLTSFAKKCGLVLLPLNIQATGSQLGSLLREIYQNGLTK